jgi:hypothetical protein
MVGCHDCDASFIVGKFELWSTTPPMYVMMKHPILQPVSTSSFQDESEKPKKGCSCDRFSVVSILVIGASDALLQKCVPRKVLSLR